MKRAIFLTNSSHVVCNVYTAYACEYIDEITKDTLVEKCNRVCGMLNKMMDNADQWCKH